ncbi:MAG: ABC transporter ATP-binding protein [Eubacteriales bacterium]
MIEVKDLKKNYKDVKAVKGISFSVKKGDFFAFLGENGAGKSTTINIIATRLKKTSGEVIIGGNRVDENDDAIRRDLGVVFQGNMLDAFLTVRENLMTRGRLYGLTQSEVKTRIELLCDQLGLTEFIDRRYGRLSGGQKRRADIARALIHEPKLLILDEPTTGLDPKTRQAVWRVVKSLSETTGLTIFLTTHYMEEAANADEIVIIDAGEIKAKGNPETLRSTYSTDRLVMIPKDRARLADGLKQMRLDYITNKETLTVELPNSFAALDIIQVQKNHIDEFEVIRGDMDDVFIRALAGNDKQEGVN